MGFVLSRCWRAQILSERRFGLHPIVFVSGEAKTGRLFRFRSISTIRSLLSRSWKVFWQIRSEFGFVLLSVSLC